MAFYTLLYAYFLIDVYSQNKHSIILYLKLPTKK